jgi:hypothetical protein
MLAAGTRAGRGGNEIFTGEKRESRLKKNSTHTRMNAEAANSGDAI